MPPNQLGQVRAKDADEIHHRVALRASRLGAFGGHPHGGNAEGGFACRRASQCGRRVRASRGDRSGPARSRPARSRMNGEFAILRHFVAGDLGALQRHYIFAGLELQVVGDPHRRHKIAHIGRDLFADGRDAAQERRSLGSFDQFDQA